MRKVCDDITILTFDRKLNIQAGEFIFLWVPGVGEKPFSALTDDPFSLVVIDVGHFTHALLDLPEGTECYVRGPHGIPVDPPEGCQSHGGRRRHRPRRGLSGRQRLSATPRSFAGARTAERLYFLEECQQIAEVHVATDDGSAGYQGVVTELLRQRLTGNV